MTPGSPAGGPAERARRSTLEQDRSVRTRAALVAAARSRWSTEPIDDVTIADLCAAAGVSKGLFYFYFSSKDDLLVELLLVDADTVATTIDRSIASDHRFDQVLASALTSLTRTAHAHPPHLLARALVAWFAAAERHDELRDGHRPLSTSLGLACDHGRSRGEIGADPDELADLLEWAVLHAMLDWTLAVGRRPGLRTRLDRRVDLILNGACR